MLTSLGIGLRELGRTCGLHDGESWEQRQLKDGVREDGNSISIAQVILHACIRRCLEAGALPSSNP